MSAIASMFVKALMAIFMRLITAKLLGEVIVYAMNYAAKLSENKLDDQLVKAVADALEVKLD